MAYTIAKATGGSLSISDGTNIEYHPFHTLGKMYYNGDDVIIQIFGVDEKATTFRKDFTSITSPAGTSLGNATYDETGGAEEDLWTLATHGLAVNDSVIFTAVGTGATGYAVDTRYYVVSVPSANTFQLSDELGGSPIEGTGDSAGTWTIARYSAKDKITKIEALFA